MRILLIHNRYKLSGGEDSVFAAEKMILENKGHIVNAFTFDNSEISSLADKLLLSYRLIFNLNSKNIIEALIRNFKPDVIHIHNFFYVASPSILFAAHNNNIPVVVTLHNYRLICSGALLMRDSKPCELCVNSIFPVKGIKYSCHRNSKIETAELTLAIGIHKLLKTWNNKVTLFISLTDFARNKFINSSLKLLPEKVIVKPNSVENIEAASFFERDDFYLFIGRLSTEKGINVLLKAFENSSFVLEIIGDGPLRSEVLEASENNRNIMFSGYQDKSYIVSRLKKCRALIVPSVCYESLPTAVLEAFSTGTPVIISDLGNLNEIVINNYNGIHFRTNDPVDLKKNIEEFNVNRSRYESLYTNARNTYLEKYTPDINYENLMNIYTLAIRSII